LSDRRSPGRAEGATARKKYSRMGGRSPRDLWQARRSNGVRVSAKEKSKAGSSRVAHPTEGERQKEIERLEKDVEELRHLAGDADADAELQRIRDQVTEL